VIAAHGILAPDALPFTSFPADRKVIPSSNPSIHNPRDFLCATDSDVTPRSLCPRLSMQLDAQSADDLEDRVDPRASLTR
jgi:hypothetical protein